MVVHSCWSIIIFVLIYFIYFCSKALLENALKRNRIKKRKKKRGRTHLRSRPVGPELLKAPTAQLPSPPSLPFLLSATARPNWPAARGAVWFASSAPFLSLVSVTWGPQVGVLLQLLPRAVTEPDTPMATDPGLHAIS